MNASNSAQLKFSQEIISALKHNGFGKIVSVETSPDLAWELLEVDISAIELPQYPAFPVKTTERIKIKVVDDSLPEVFCRRDFPMVPHLNVLNNGEKSLCLFDVPFQDIKYMFNASMFLKRIIFWFSKTARGELHQPDQPLEPFFPSVRDVIILNDFQPEIPFIRLKEIKTGIRKILMQIPLEETSTGSLFTVTTVNINKKYSDNIINRLPQTLADLNEAFEENILEEIEKCILPIWSIKKNPELFKQLFQQREKEVKKCNILLLITVSLARHTGAEIERTERKAFAIETTFQLLYGAFGYKKKGSKLIKTNDMADMNQIPLTQFEVSHYLNRRIAQILNGIEDLNCDENFLQIGVGALGSQIANNFIRAGYGRWVYIDPDPLYSHNLARHCLTIADLGLNKAMSMKVHSERILSDTHDASVQDYMPEDFLDREKSEKICQFINDSKMVVDTSTSIAVERYLCHELAGRTRCICFFMNPDGSCAVMLLEDKNRRITLDTLEMQYYKVLINKTKYKDHLTSEQRVVYSSSCRNASLKFSQDNVAIFSGLCSKAIKHATHNDESLIAIWMANGLSLDTEVFQGEIFKPYIYDDWTVKVSSSVESAFYEQRHQKLPLETGGVLIGAYDHERKICYIVELISSPDDSIESPNSYIRGCKGLLKRIEEIEIVTAGNLGYIGEWHSHPNDHTEQSADDKKLMRTIVEYNASQSSPGCMIIVGETHISIYLDIMG